MRKIFQFFYVIIAKLGNTVIIIETACSLLFLGLFAPFSSGCESLFF